MQSFSRFYDNMPSTLYSTKGSIVSEFVYRTAGNYEELDAKYATLLKDDVFRNFIVENDKTAGHTPSAGPDYYHHPGIGFEDVLKLFENLHSGKGMGVLKMALIQDGFVVLKDEWGTTFVYYTNPDSFHQWMEHPTDGVSSYSIFNP